MIEVVPGTEHYEHLIQLGDTQLTVYVPLGEGIFGIGQDVEIGIDPRVAFCYGPDEQLVNDWWFGETQVQAMSNGLVIENPIAPISTLPKKRKGFAKTQGPWLFLAVVVGVLVLLPIIPLLLRALADSGQGFRDLAQLPNLGRLLWQTVALALGR